MTDNMDKSSEILLGLTTTPGSNWEKKVEEIKIFNIKKFALFPTFLNLEKRKKLYSLLEEIENLTIPHVHLRTDDMEEWEMELFENKYETEVYNIHPVPLDSHLIFKKYKHKIFIENSGECQFLEKYVCEYAGLCPDFSHLEDKKRPFFISDFKKTLKTLKNSPIGCCHVSAIHRSSYNPLAWLFGRDDHFLKKLSEIDYMKKYLRYLPKYVSLELENSFVEQLKIKSYLEKIIAIN